MDAHFRAFSFVDRITSVSQGRQIRGRFAVPSTLSEFPLSLVGEAVGQLAAWAAMAEVNFTLRPVAGLAGSVELIGESRPGQVLELTADLESVDAESVAYGGTAHADGQLILRLQDCLGPMVPLADFDDPQALRARFDTLCQAGATPGGFPGLPRLSFERTGGEPGQWISAAFQVPSDTSLFGDHFPRRHVFPGSLLMHLNLQLASALASEFSPAVGGQWVPGTILNMKLRSFIPPGAKLELRAKLKHHSPDSASLSLETRAANEIIATAGLALKVGEGL
jgi:3-hydroxymyristoyl/3-hydroxydecanoyl-(acyl carrier protein) dehydratase